MIGRKYTRFAKSLTIIVTLFSSLSHASVFGKCENIFSHPSELNTVQSEILTRLQNSVKTPSSISISEGTLLKVFNHELREYEDRLKNILTPDGNLTLENLIRFYESMHFPKTLIETRVKQSKNLRPENVISVLGDLTFNESLIYFAGTKEQIERGTFNEDSLLGRYLNEAGAKASYLPFVHKASRKQGEIERGGRRLVIPIDATTLPIWKKYFTNKQFYSVMGHGNLIFNGQHLSQTGKMSPSEIGMPGTAYTPMPLVLLKTTEGLRLENYIKAFRVSTTIAGNGLNPRSWDNPARAPWNQVPGKDGLPYMEGVGHYGCCVHWQGNMPIGDKLVTEITLPGPGDAGIKVKINPPDYSNPNLEHVKNIWTYPLHEPVSSLLGMADNNGRGEFASSGWVIQSLLVDASIERVPIVFMYVQNAKENLQFKQVKNPNYEHPF